MAGELDGPEQKPPMWLSARASNADTNRFQGLRAVGRPANAVSDLTTAQEMEFVDGQRMAAIFCADPLRTESLFASEASKKEAWNVHGDRLCADEAAKRPGDRPKMFWETMGCPELAESDQKLDLRRVTFLLDGRHLYDSEARELIRQANAARARVAAGAELYSPPPFEYYADRVAAEIGTLIEAYDGAA